MSSSDFSLGLGGRTPGFRSWFNHGATCFSPSSSLFRLLSRFSNALMSLILAFFTISFMSIPPPPTPPPPDEDVGLKVLAFLGASGFPFRLAGGRVLVALRVVEGAR